MHSQPHCPFSPVRLALTCAPLSAVRLLLDAHINAGTAGVPVALDTHRAPVTLSRIAAHDVLFRWVRVLAAGFRTVAE